jgi:hypothetical protein
MTVLIILGIAGFLVIVAGGAFLWCKFLSGYIPPEDYTPYD